MGTLTAARRLLLACLVFSGVSALVYQVVWTRLLGFAFGTTTEAIGTVLAVFFGGMALGNWLAARQLQKVRRPLRVYAVLELGIGLFALGSLPVLRSLDGLYGLLGADAGPTAFTILRLLASVVVLLPPTVAMGATLPVVAHGLVERDETLGRWSSYIYSANTLGAVLGAYLCGFWMIPAVGLSWTVALAALANLAVAAAVFVVAGERGNAGRPQPAPDRSPSPPDARADRGDGEDAAWYLFFFGISGFVAIGYEIIWSKVFTVVMEGTLYGFATVLSAYLLGIAAGSLAISGAVDRIRDLPRTFGLLHLGIAVCVAAGIVVVGDLPFWHDQISPPDGGGGIHRLYLIAVPIVLLPTALFGAAFPVLIRLYTTRASGVGRGVGLATAVNTVGSIAASLSISFVFIQSIGIDATLYLLLLAELGVAVAVLLQFQVHLGWDRMKTALPALLVAGVVAGLYDGVHVERAVIGRWVDGDSLREYRTQINRRAAQTALVVEGRSSVVTVQSTPEGWSLQNNGMPEAAFQYAPPYRALESLLLGILPYVTAEDPERALVIGFGGGSTLDGLMDTDIEHIEVVELEQGVVDAIPLLYRGRPSPLDDPRVEIVVNDGRNALLRDRHRGEPRYDVIASQPSHPWLAGAANLFTREYFELARDNLRPGGVFSVWVNGFHMDVESLLSIATSFEAVFPGSLLFGAGDGDVHSSFILVGGRDPMTLDVERMRARLAEPALAEQLGLHGVFEVEDLLVRSEGPTAAFATLWDGPANDDDNAYVETRLSRTRSWSHVDFERIESRLPVATRLWPRIRGDVDVAAVARRIAPRPGVGAMQPYHRKLRRILAAHGEGLGSFERELLAAEAAALGAPDPAAGLAALEALAAAHPDRPETWRTLGGHAAWHAHLADRAARAFAEAWLRSDRAEDAARAAYWFRRAGAGREARAWLARVPAHRLEELPELAPVRAAAALSEGADRAELARRDRDLRRWRDTEIGRAEPGLHALLAGLARALGRPEDVRLWSDLDHRERQKRGSTLIRSVRSAIARGDYSAAGNRLGKAAEILPGDPRVAELSFEIAAALGDRERFEQSVLALRRSASSLDAAVATENRLRARLGLPLLPQRKPEDLLGTTAPPTPVPSTSRPRLTGDSPRG